MCKIMVINGIKDETRENATLFIKEMAKQLSSGSDKDGMGYAAISKEGKLFGERWLNNSDAFVNRFPFTLTDQALINSYGGLLSKPNIYNSFGKIDLESVTSMTLHARFATSGKEFFNTHPFVKDSTSLIHNGVIDNIDKNKDLFQSTCDSEKILNKYLEFDVTNSINNVQKLAHSLKGYYACAVYSKTKSGQVILDVFKDYTASLYAVFIKELNTVVLTTSYAHVKGACDKLSFTIVSEYIVNSGVLHRMDAVTGKSVNSVKFNPFYKSKKVKFKKRSNKSAFLDEEKWTANRFVMESEEYDDWVYDRDLKGWKRNNL